MIPLVVLAAGKSTRMGRSKSALPLGDETFVGRIVRTAREAGVDDVVVVVGHDAATTRQSLESTGFATRCVENPEYESGQLSSVLAGLAAVDTPEVEAVLLTLVDVPLVSAATIRAVLDRYRATKAPIVRAIRRQAGREIHGHPVLVDRSLFGLLRAADPQVGAKPIVRAYASAAGDVEVDDPGAFLDIDTPEDYERLLRRS